MLTKHEFVKRAGLKQKVSESMQEVRMTIAN